MRQLERVPTIRFGRYELDLERQELRSAGLSIRLRPQSFAVLTLLAQRAGELVTRQELQEQIWKDNTHVDFEIGLNTCIKEIRGVLNDLAKTPQYIETLHRRGYRFIAPVSRIRTPVRIGVLPFRNLGGDPSEDFFCEGLTEEMITQLGRLYPESLRVIARTSMMQYKQEKGGMEQIGRELGVDYILEGTLRRNDSRVRITVQLTQVSGQANIWAESYQFELGDILTIQAEVAHRVASALGLRLGIERAIDRVRTVNPEAYEAYLKGRYFWNQRTRESLHKGLAYFEEAIARDPSYSLAHAGVADTYLVLADWVLMHPGQAYPRAKEAALNALQIDESLAEAHLVLGVVCSRYEWKWGDADREIQRALELNPSAPAPHQYRAEFLLHTGQYGAALREMERARELDPLSLIINSLIAFVFYYAGEYERSIGQCHKVLEFNPHFVPAHYFLGLAYERKGLREKAIRQLEEARKHSPDTSAILAALGYAYAMAGKKHAAQRILAALEELSKKQYVSPFGRAFVWTGLGSREKALNWLEKAYEERANEMIYLKIVRQFDCLWVEPRFQELVRKIGFPD